MKNIISEVFTSLQGEGSRVGIVSDFIRTLGCNLRCTWCDSPYTSWNLEKGKHESYAFDYIKESPEGRDIVLTGGEPCLHKNFISRLLQIEANKNKFITLETNGTINLPEEDMERINLVSISPKLSNSVVPYSNNIEVYKKYHSERINIFTIVKWIAYAKDWQLKFVVSSDRDLDEISNLIDEIKLDARYYNWSESAVNEKVWLMPEGKSEEELVIKRQWLAQKCIETGYRYCERQHIVIWGNKRGV